MSRNWFEQALYDSYLSKAEQRVRTPDLSILAGDQWALDNPEEHAADMARYEAECKKPVIHNPDGTVTLPFTGLPHYKWLNIMDMQRRYLSMENG
ncbi:MAG: hypothetical protein ABII80_01180 [bacterium]